MSEELKPCPFCGKEPKHQATLGVWCDNDDCSIVGTVFSGGAPHWNRRAAPQPAPATGDVHIECRECTNCGHVGIEDMHESESHCSNCDWHGPSPTEDVCPGCAQRGTMGAACPKCSYAYRLLCETTLQASAAHRREGWQPIETVPKDGTEVALLFDYEVTLLDKARPRVRAASWLGDWTIPYRLDNPPTHWMPLPAAPAHGEPGALEQGDAL